MANRRYPISTVNFTAGAGHPHHATQRNGRNFSPCVLKIDGQKAGKVYQLHPVVNPDSIQPQRNTVIERRPSLGDYVLFMQCREVSLNYTVFRDGVEEKDPHLGQTTAKRHFYESSGVCGVSLSSCTCGFEALDRGEGVIRADAVHSWVCSSGSLLMSGGLTFPKLILISQTIVMELFSWKPRRKSRDSN
ncbi:hypothetical protein QQF64_016415 [Cirrhinus molitorella]|uniref:Uncharacterized protein n=1 Tax=Cirrhinus molitorella TaxID=172907 RepID=A0ABR3LQ98_9TELE